MIEDVLTKHGLAIVRNIQDNLKSTGTNASGKTSDSVRFEVSNSSGVVTLRVIGGRAFFPTVETGSKPAKTDVPPREMIQSLTEWAQDKGVEASPWAIAKTILKKGSKLYREGGRTDIYTNVIEDSKKLIRRDILADQKKELIIDFK